MNLKTIRGRVLPVAALALAVPLALSACGGGGEPTKDGRSTAPAVTVEDDTEPTFTFADSSQTIAGEKITLEMPDGVGDAVPAYPTGRILEAVVLTPIEIDANYCAINYEFIYADGGLNRAKSLYEGTSSSSTSEYDAVADALRFSSVPQDVDIDLEAGTGQLGSITKASGELADDYASAVAITDCASGPTDEANTLSVIFPYRTENLDKAAGGVEVLASAKIAVQKDGTLSVVDSTTNGMRVSSDGTVIKAQK